MRGQAPAQGRVVENGTMPVGTPPCLRAQSSPVATLIGPSNLLICGASRARSLVSGSSRCSSRSLVARTMSRARLSADSPKAVMRETRQRIEACSLSAGPLGAIDAAGPLISLDSRDHSSTRTSKRAPKASNPEQPGIIAAISGTSASNHPLSTAIPKIPRRPKPAQPW